MLKCKREREREGKGERECKTLKRRGDRVDSRYKVLEELTQQ